MKTPELAAALALGALLCAASPSASATQYVATGTVDFGNGGDNLPAGVTFGDSSYNAGSGSLSAGRFVFPQATASNQTDYGELVVTYQLSQDNTSIGLVDGNGNAVLTTASLKLHIVSVTLSGLPISVGSNCEFEPVVWDALAGTATSSGMDLTQVTFKVPEAASGSCGSFTDDLNNALAGNDNSVALHLAGAFAPPAVSDLIYLNGFESH